MACMRWSDMATDLHLINEVWYGIREDLPKMENMPDVTENSLDYYTIMVVGIYLLRHPEIASKFVHQTWKDPDND